MRTPIRVDRIYRLSLLLLCLAVALPSLHAAAQAKGIAIHLDTDAHMNRSLRQVQRHLDGNPGVPVRVILVAGAVNAALEGAVDDNGGLYAAQMEQLLASGARIFACENTLTSFNKSPDDLTFGIETVESGVAELGRLQVALGFGYLKL